MPTESNAASLVHLEVWSDIACPWCYIGGNRLTQALAELPAGDRDRVQVRWRSYELSPDRAVGGGERELDALMTAKGMTAEQVEGMFGHVASTAQADGLAIDFGTTVAANTFDAHRLVHLAGADTERGAAVLDALFTAHFVEGVAVDDRQALVKIAAAVGFDADEVAQALADDTASDAVRADEQIAAELGVTGVPFFVANRKYAVSGAQPVEVLTQLLRTALDNAS
ncbi:DsbA family oxidoreductase [Tomitella biformata]|uniref:DsbA family oxidoreductase n=1 Tax=Tomitella biformata TaxID=630403 RepID=UPI0004634A1A|nr:DsbA family oxidoreductase [Tomitella biformata]